MDKSKIDLDKPAFGEGAQKLQDIVAPEKTPEPEPVPAPAPQVKVEPEVKEEVIPESSVEEQRVPYSRFKNIHQRALDAERLAEEWRQKAEELRSRPVATESSSDTPPPYWVKMYGDSPEAKEAWGIQRQHDEEIARRAEERAVQALEERSKQESNRAKENEAQLDENLESLSAFVGRDLTDREQSAVLDIVDEYTPKGNDGNYAGELLPFEKAWEIYELKQKAQNASKIQSRDSVAALGSTPSQGETTIKAEQEKNWNPLDWNAWKKRL